MGSRACLCRTQCAPRSQSGRHERAKKEWRPVSPPCEDADIGILIASGDYLRGWQLTRGVKTCQFKEPVPHFPFRLGLLSLLNSLFKRKPVEQSLWVFLSVGRVKIHQATSSYKRYTSDSARFKMNPTASSRARPLWRWT